MICLQVVILLVSLVVGFIRLCLWSVSDAIGEGFFFVAEICIEQKKFWRTNLAR